MKRQAQDKIKALRVLENANNNTLLNSTTPSELNKALRQRKRAQASIKNQQAVIREFS